MSAPTDEAGGGSQLARAGPDRASEFAGFANADASRIRRPRRNSAAPTASATFTVETLELDADEVGVQVVIDGRLIAEFDL